VSTRTRIVTGGWIGGALVLVVACTAFFSSRPSTGDALPSPSASAPAASSSAPPPTSAPGATPTAADLLATLPVKGRAPSTGYDRTADFGAAWLDVDHNGCDTRNDILARDLAGVVCQGVCRVLTGTLDDPYTGSRIAFVRGDRTSALVQIDHVVALQNAWVTGAQQLSPAQRIRLANDPLNLLAVDGASNQQKSSGDAATWLPRNKAFRCSYVARQISVKAAYHLWVTRAEHDAMARILATCPTQPSEHSALPPAG
jgi:hypothetical protein